MSCASHDSSQCSTAATGAITSSAATSPVPTWPVGTAPTTRAPSTPTPMNASTRPIPNSTVSTTLPFHGRTKRSSVRTVSGQPIVAASSFSGRTCGPDDARAVAPAAAVVPTDSATASSCGPISRRYGPSRAISAACVPSSTTCPWSSTRMRSAPITLDSRCASTSVVRPRVSRSSACWISASFSASTDDSASSSSRIGASRSSARAIAMRWRWPPDSMSPRSPMRVA